MLKMAVHLSFHHNPHCGWMSQPSVLMLLDLPGTYPPLLLLLLCGCCAAVSVKLQTELALLHPSLVQGIPAQQNTIYIISGIIDSPLHILTNWMELCRGRCTARKLYSDLSMYTRYTIRVLIALLQVCRQHNKQSRPPRAAPRRPH